MNDAAHPLDRPVWSALAGRQRNIAIGGAAALRMAPDYGLFAAARDRSRDAMSALAALAAVDGSLATFEADALPPPPGLAIVREANCEQFVAATLASAPPSFAFEDLTPDDAPAMLELALLTEPGPFRTRTGALGRFVGVRRDGRLIAMAGERLKPPGHTEVSGVCTNPDARGRGYAAGLMHVVAARILARGEIPFLHAYAANAGAIALYRRLGYRPRRTLVLTMFAPDAAAG